MGYCTHHPFTLVRISSGFSRVNAFAALRAAFPSFCRYPLLVQLLNWFTQLLSSWLRIVCFISGCGDFSFLLRWKYFFYFSPILGFGFREFILSNVVDSETMSTADETEPHCLLSSFCTNSQSFRSSLRSILGLIKIHFYRAIWKISIKEK